MNRRFFITGITGLTLTPVSALASIPKNNEWITTTNKLGLPATYSKSLAADLWSIYGIDCEKVLQNMCGTSFKIVNTDFNKTSDFNKTRINVFSTNDIRDGHCGWFEGKSNKDMTNWLIRNIKWKHKKSFI